MSKAETKTAADPGYVADPEAQVRQVREEYARVAKNRSADWAGCCSGETCGSGSERYGYDTGEIAGLPQDADMGLGCGAPLTALDPQPGETILDLGSGGGIDAFLAARAVGERGRVIGVDMTPEMIELARENARKGGYPNTEFRQGRLEALPVDDGTVDAVTSNCVINLVPDKAKVFGEVARVLRSGGRIVVSDVMIDGALPESLLREMETGNCITTAIDRETYLEILRRSGLVQVTVLRDVDYLEMAGWDSPERINQESQALLERARVSYDEIRGRIRSVTVRAVKP